MIKSLKGQFILAIITATLFVVGSFFYIQFNGDDTYIIPRILMYIAMIAAIFNAGMLTQKFLDKQK
ncbi:hypothetical protein QA612_17405 [Evansella sp. AB-P1]|uniref:hypothetical protein n=1 Tax=Evansella sp. AB-P1 TaxID=3037653 RepID=UPI00241E8C23|nr:hypothetical protein [Evansella sp. AB-P1]MDG5789239.1 hypothetical protein [Evansella sp. AB-P1]